MPDLLEFTVVLDEGDGDFGLVGTISFAAEFRGGDMTTAKNLSPRPKMFPIQTRYGYVDDSQQLKRASGEVGVRLTACDPELDIPQLPYRADFDLYDPDTGQAVPIQPAYFAAPATDTTVYLVKVIGEPGRTSIVAQASTYIENILDASQIAKDILGAPTTAAARASIGIADSDIYNCKPENTRRLQQSMAKALAGLASDHLVLGDSTSSGYVGSMNYPAAWPWQLRTLMSQRGIPLGGTGWVFPCHGAGFAIDPRWVRVGAWAFATGYIWSITPGDTLTYTSDMPGQTVKIATLYAGGSFTVSIDGRAAETVTVPGSPGDHDVHIYTKTGLADTIHTVTITVTTSDPTFILGGAVLRSTGLQIHNCSQIGQNAYQWPEYTSRPQRGWVVNKLGLTPDVVHIPLGVNDIDYGQTIVQTVTSLTAIRNAWPNADVILHAQAAPSSAASVPNPPDSPGNVAWGDFVDALYDLARTLNVPLVNWYRMTGGSYAAANAAGLMGDPIHPNAVAESMFARAVADAMTLKAGI